MVTSEVSLKVLMKLFMIEGTTRRSACGRTILRCVCQYDKPSEAAASICPVWHDSYGGLRINGKGQVLDMEGAAIPGLYSGGEASGGGNQHGLGRALVHGYIAGGAISQERA